MAIESDDLALYRAKRTGLSPGRVLSFLYLGADRGGWTAPPDLLTLAESWLAEGCYFFSEDFETADLSALRRALVVSARTANRGQGWVSGAGTATPRAVVIPMTWTGADEARVTLRTHVPLINVALTLQENATVRFASDGAPGLTFLTGSSGEPQIFLSRGQVVSREPDAPGVTLGFQPEAEDSGQLRFAATWRAQEFLTLFRDDPLASDPAWGGEIRYFVQPPGESVARQIVYPVFQAPKPSVVFKLSAKLDPLAPEDPGRTAFGLPGDAATLGVLSSDFARTTDGRPVRLLAQSGISLYLARKLPRGEDAQAYLAVQGRYAIDLGPATEARLMCALTNQEYITVRAGDEIELLPALPAYADLNDRGKGLSAIAAGTEAPVLDDRCTTSWAMVRPALSRADGGNATYFSQPQLGTNFDHRALPGTGCAAATTSLIGPAEASSPFPLALYGGIYPPSAAIKGWPNADVEPALFATAESGALSPTRFGVLSRAVGTQGPVICDMSGTPMSGGRSTTPNGTLLELGGGVPPTGVAASPAGGWARLVLGKSGDGQEIAFNGKANTGLVDPAVAQALLNPQTFLVLNRWDAFREFQGFVSVQGVDVNLAPPEGTPNERETILVFKYADNETLENLVDRVDAWDSPATFVGSAPEVAAAREVLLAAIRNARQQADAPGAPFRHFLDLLVDPAWTGFLVFNAPLDGRRMPADFQMVLGGIDGQLRAHHFGAETSLVTLENDLPTIDRTALVGVFFYLEPPAALQTEPAYAFRTTKLIIGIRNSTIELFTAQIAVTVNELFGRPVRGNGIQPGDSPNTLRLDGSYQVIDGVGRVVFEAPKGRSFGFRLSKSDIRVLEEFALSGAALTPVTGGPEGTEAVDVVTVRSRLAMDGELFFVEAPFPAKVGQAALDIFTYGVVEDGQKRGLPVTGLSLDMEFALGPNGREGAIKITPGFADLVATDNAARRRPGGFVSGLPMRLTGLLSGKAALDAVKRTGKVIGIPDLVANAPLPDETAAKGLDSIPVLNAVTTTPTFALAFEMPLGSIGDLADTGVGLTCGMILGWGPAASMPEADGLALYVQLPSLVGGLVGFNLQGLLKTTFGDANLARVEYKPDVGEPRGVYVLLFNNVALSVFGITLPPKVVTDFILFADPRPDDPARRGNSNIAWSLAATQVASK
jgi:hypothetical protein